MASISPSKRPSRSAGPTALARTFLVLSLALLLTGCVGAPRPVTKDPDASVVPPTRFPWAYDDCQEIVAQFDVDSDALAQALPAGFRPGPGMAPGRTAMGIDAFACKTGAAVAGPTGGASYSSFWAVVDAPPELLGEAQAAFVKWDALVQDPVSRAALLSVGASVRDGRVEIAPVGTSATTATTGTILLDGLGTVTITIPPGPQRPVAASTQLLREFSTTGNEVALWETHLARDGQVLSTAGFADVPAEAMPARLYGSTRIPCTLSLGHGALEGGYVQLDARRAATKP